MEVIGPKSISSSSRSVNDGWLLIHPCPPIVGTFEPLIGNCGHHYVAHVTIGLERLAAAEVREKLAASPVVVLQGKIAFGTESPYSSIKLLRSVESVSIMCWVTPTPAMPADATAFGEAFRALLAEHVLPHWAALGRAGLVRQRGRADVVGAPPAAAEHTARP